MDNTAIRARATRKLKICAIVCLCLLMLLIILQFLNIDQTRRDQNIVVNAIMLLIAIGIFLLKRYWWAILLVAFTLVGNQL